MHWYFQLSSLVFIPFPALPSSLFMPCNCYLGLQLGGNGSLCPWAKALLFLTRVRNAGNSDACSWGCVGAHQGPARGELPAAVGNALDVGGSFLWGSSGFAVEVLWSSCAGPTLFQAVVVSSPGLYRNFHSFSRVPCKPSANPGESAGDVLVIWDWSSTVWPSPS